MWGLHQRNLKREKKERKKFTTYVSCGAVCPCVTWRGKKQHWSVITVRRKKKKDKT